MTHSPYDGSLFDMFSFHGLLGTANRIRSDESAHRHDNRGRLVSVAKTDVEHKTEWKLKKTKKKKNDNSSDGEEIR